MKQLKLLLATGLVGIGFLSFVDKNIAAEKGLDVGNEAPAFNAELIDGAAFNLENHRGKMVLINFWASYHATSRMNNFHLNKLYNTYKTSAFNKGEELVVVSISLDRFMTPLFRAVEQDETNDFMHICDLQGNNGAIAQLFEVEEPINILLDGEGRILAKDTRYQKLEKALSFLSLN